MDRTYLCVPIPTVLSGSGLGKWSNTPDNQGRPDAHPLFTETMNKPLLVRHEQVKSQGRD